ncbi:hypothetical protein OOK41_03735 [Micromonospora sp. NBC_01655]|uniref:hypothetical protein n=1 Tax=Micromonospora sp. NBC_01655 TaxID=2975983 RepID=UPI00225050AF|nr:hypothetical protein [Micromonospora sp. NBC_01655]MCX4469424.1 hypothetical protein [Micromonospora sp. NBC_01655]
MQTRRFAATMLTVATSVGLGVTGCGPATSKNDSSGPLPTCSPTNANAAGRQAEGKAELTSAAGWVTEQTVRVATEDMETTGGAVTHAQERSGSVHFKFRKTDRTILITVFGDDVYFNMHNVPGISFGTSYTLSRSQVPVGSRLDFAPEDPGYVSRLVNAVVDVRRDGAGKAGGKSGFAGELDLMATPHADEALCRKYGRKVHAVPFTAATDDQDRLVEFAIQMNALGPDLGTARTTWHKVDGQTSPLKPRNIEPAGDVLALLKALES